MYFGSRLSTFTVIALGTLFFITGFKYTFDVAENECTMTWMYEPPEYVKVALPEEVRLSYHQYSLYVYGEGWYANTLRKGDFRGTPILFIPGNSGSYKQVRSLASVALRKSESTNIHFNYFVPDFKEQLSALHGAYMHDQADFVKHCIHVIRALYPRDPERKLILIGHSVGGVIARILFQKHNISSDIVPLVITLSTPHMASVVPFEESMAFLYNSLNSYWHYQLLASKKPTVTWKDLLMSFCDLSSPAGTFHGKLNWLWSKTYKSKDLPALLSVGGGERDFLVKSDLTSLDDIVLYSALSVVSTSVPRVWVSTDHQCIVWCNQLVLAINRALFDLVDPSKRQLSDDKEHIMAILRHHFLMPRNQGQIFGVKYYQEKCVSALGKPLFSPERCKRVTGETQDQDSLKTKCQIFPKQNRRLHINFNANTEVCLIVCKNDSWSTCRPLNQTYRTLPPYPTKSGPRFFCEVDLNSLSYGEQIVVHTRDSMDTFIELEESISSGLVLAEPSLMKVLRQTIEVEAVASYFMYSLPSITNPWDVYEVQIIVDSQSRGSTSVTARFAVPWSHEDRYATGANRLNLQTMFFRPKPFGASHAFLELWLERKVRFSITLHRSWKKTLSQLLRSVFPMLVLKSISVGLFLQLLLGDPRNVSNKKTVSLSLFCILSQFLIPSISNPETFCFLPMAATILLSLFFTWILYFVCFASLNFAKMVGQILQTRDSHNSSRRAARWHIVLWFLLSLSALLLTCPLISLVTSYILLHVVSVKYSQSTSRRTATLGAIVLLYCVVVAPNGLVWVNQVQASSKFDFDGNTAIGICISFLPYLAYSHFASSEAKSIMSVIVSFVFISSRIMTMGQFAAVCTTFLVLL